MRNRFLQFIFSSGENAKVQFSNRNQKGSMSEAKPVFLTTFLILQKKNPATNVLLYTVFFPQILQIVLLNLSSCMQVEIYQGGKVKRPKPFHKCLIILDMSLLTFPYFKGKTALISQQHPTII